MIILEKINRNLGRIFIFIATMRPIHAIPNLDQIFNSFLVCVIKGVTLLVNNFFL